MIKRWIAVFLTLFMVSGFFLLPVQAQQDAAGTQTKTPAMIGHKGYSEKFPENTDALPQVCTAVAGTPLTFTAPTEIIQVKSSRRDKARVSHSSREITVNAAATGNTTVTVTDTGGTSSSFDVYTYASQAQYDYLRALFQGKTFSILGDSISTLEPWDDGGASHYYDTARVGSCGPDSGFADKAGRPTGGIAIRYQDTYWGNLQTRFGMRLFSNVSCKKKTVTGWMEDDAQIRRLGKKGTPDIIFFFGGSNDIIRSENVRMFRAAYQKVLKKLKAAYPKAMILALLPCALPGYQPYERAAKQICKAQKITYIPLSATGITSLHPHAKGFSKIADCILDTLYQNYASAPAGTKTSPLPATAAAPAYPAETTPANTSVAAVLRMLQWLRMLFAQLVSPDPAEAGALPVSETADASSVV